MTFAQFLDCLSEVPGLNEKAKSGTEGVMSASEIKRDREEFIIKYMVI